MDETRDAEVRRHRDERLRRLWESMPFNALCGLRVSEWGPDLVTIFCPYRDVLTNGARTVHGGAISALADTAATGVVIAGRGDDDRRVPVTISLATTFVGAAVGDLEARATVTRRGRTTCFVHVLVTGDAGPVAEALATIHLR